MNEFQLKYGCNPNQKPSRIYMENGAELPIEILSGRPGYINFLDAIPTSSTKKTTMAVQSQQLRSIDVFMHKIVPKNIRHDIDRNAQK